MKLFRTAFWLGIVIYNLPNTGSESTPPASHTHEGQHLAANAANSRDAVRPSLDTLGPSDRAVRWRGSYELARQNKLVTPEPWSPPIRTGKAAARERGDTGTPPPSY
jgi:hypothetical protein